MLSSGVCSRMFSLTIKQCPHQKKDVRKYASIPLSSTFYDVFESHHGPVNPGKFYCKVWCSEHEVKVDDEWHKIDNVDTTLFNIMEIFPIKYIKFSCLKRAEDKPDADMEEEKQKVWNTFDVLMQLPQEFVKPKITR